MARRLRKRAELFDELRDALRLVPKPSGRNETAPAKQLPPEEALEELRDIQDSVERLVASLRARRPERGPAQDTRKAIDLLLRHIEKHGNSLWGHAISLPEEAGGGIRLVERTNNLLETFFRGMKHGERRRSGRKILTQDFENLPAAAALARNLARPDYVAILCGTLDRLPQAFAGLDAEKHRRTLAAELLSPHARPEPETASASFPSEDRRIVRSERMRRRVLAAARSRAPRASAGPASGGQATAK